MLYLVRNIARPLSIQSIRTFHLTPRRLASEDKEAFFNAFRNTTVFQKLANHPEAVSALEDFAKLMQAKGNKLQAHRSFIYAHAISQVSTSLRENLPPQCRC